MRREFATTQQKIIHLACVMHLFFMSQVESDMQAQTKDEKYTHSISLNEKRILEGKLEFKEKGKFPTEWKLYFKGKEGDFAVFYDWNGHEIHCRFRRNKFDIDGDLFAKDLLAGNPYQIQGEWIGFYYYPTDARGLRSVSALKKSLPAKAEEFTELHSIPIFKLISYKEIFTDQLLY